jgi:hypothetical protein
VVGSVKEIVQEILGFGILQYGHEGDEEGEELEEEGEVCAGESESIFVMVAGVVIVLLFCSSR